MIQQANARRIEERLENIENAIASISAELKANGARFHNERLRDSQNWRAGDYEVVVKYKLGHPYGPPPSCPDVQFDRSYPSILDRRRIYCRRITLCLLNGSV
ncbi:hypothetical protein ACP275_10G118100 [Erythranthe tilingii]